MKKTNYFISLGIACCMLLLSNTSLFAQKEGEKKAAVQFSVWGPIGTNGRAYKEYTNIFSFNLLYGRSYSEQAFVFSGLANSTGNMNGLQFSGLASNARNVAGIQFSGLASNS